MNPDDFIFIAPSAWMRRIRKELVTGISDYQGTVQDAVWLPVYFGILVACLTLEGFWNIVEFFIDLSDAIPVPIDLIVDEWEEEFKDWEFEELFTENSNEH